MTLTYLVNNRGRNRITKIDATFYRSPVDSLLIDMLNSRSMSMLSTSF
jgi:hypothetical protein